MGDAAKDKARSKLRSAQAEYERKQGEAKKVRLDSFRQAQKAGLSLREIADEVGLHFTSVGEILRGD